MKADAMNGACKVERRYERAIDWLLDALNDVRTPADVKITIAIAVARIQASGAAREGKKAMAQLAAERASRNGGKFATPAGPMPKEYS